MRFFVAVWARKCAQHRSPSDVVISLMGIWEDLTVRLLYTCLDTGMPCKNLSQISLYDDSFVGTFLKLTSVLWWIFMCPLKVLLSHNISLGQTKHLIEKPFINASIHAWSLQQLQLTFALVKCEHFSAVKCPFACI